MGGDRLDQQLGPIAEFLLIIIALLFVAAVTAYFLTKAVQRRKERAHGKLSGSRRTGHSKIDLFAKPEETGRTTRGSGRARRSSSGESGIDILKRPSGTGASED
jgi:hypothetical protein